MIIIVFGWWKIFSKIAAIYQYPSKNPSDIGSEGERYLYNELKNLFHINHIFRNIYLPKSNGNLAEIDLFAVTQKGIYVFESKNYSGMIFGGEKDTYWTQVLNRNTKNRFYNPIRQNNSHINALKFALKSYPDMRYFNIVVFSERCECRIDPIGLPDTYVVQRSSLESTLLRIARSHKEIISSEQRKEVIRLLLTSSRTDDEIDEQHINQIKTKCPYCGSDLVERTNRSNGSNFYGCKSYPACNFTKPIPYTTP